jgi:predicted metal-dependent peptidase
VEIVKPERIRVIWADDKECGAMEVFEPEDEIILNPIGGGGTDMRKPLKFAETFDPVCVILITDCFTPWPDRPTPYPLVTLSSTRKKCPHGTTIHFAGAIEE